MFILGSKELNKKRLMQTDESFYKSEYFLNFFQYIGLHIEEEENVFTFHLNLCG